MISLNLVTKQYPGKNGSDVVALENVVLEINKSEFVTVTGASGSGKSTLLFTIGGMLEPTSGKVFVDDIEIYGLSPAKRAGLRRNKIGMVFQTFNLIPYLSCLENVALPSLLAGNSRKESLYSAKNMLEKLGLGHRIHHQPMKVSVGERQRVAILRSMINKPDVILADEPTGNLDPDTAEEVMKLFVEINKEGQTIVMVTHDHNLSKMGQRTIKIKNGCIEDE